MWWCKTWGRWRSRWPIGSASAALVLLAALGQGPAGPTCPANVAPQVWEGTEDQGQTTFLVVLREQAGLRGASLIAERGSRGRFVVSRLRETAQRSQAGVRRLLDQRGVSYRSFYVVNALAVTGDRGLVAELASRPEVDRIAADPPVRMATPQPLLPSAALAPLAVEWNVQRVNADDVWALGHTGEGVVVAGQDTGYDWDHPALIDAYRGSNGAAADHDYNWHDAIHTNTHGFNVCGVDSAEPCDDNGHGTHTMGTVVGSGGIGVAPGAQWIGCRNMDNDWGTPASYIECFEFFLAPYPVAGDPSQGDPTKAPHVVNNSWVCPTYEGCPSSLLQQTVENVRAAGILVVASAGNEGPLCSTVQYPAALYEAAFTVGATTSTDAIATFSSRGPVTEDGSGRRKPDVSAPGVGVLSSVPGGGYGSMSGTSMAGPHVAGAAALLWSAEPDLVGNVDGTEQVIEQTARPRTTSQVCGDDDLGDVPNNVYGWGIVDALAAVERARPALEVDKRATFPWGLPARVLEYTLIVTNTSALTVTDVVLTDTVPAGVPLARASGIYTETGGVVTWAPAALGPGARLTATLVVTVSHLPPGSQVVNERYGARAGDGVTPVTGAPVPDVVPWRVLLLLVMRGWGG